MLYYEKRCKTYKELQDEKVCKVERFFNKKLIDIIKECNFPQYTTYIVEGNIVKLKEEYKDIYDNIVSCVYAADKRTPMEYAKDLVISWVLEVYMMENLIKQGLDIKRNGGDKDLLILKQDKVNTDSDFIVDGRKIELITNYTDYWKRNNCFELRDSKLKHLYNNKSLVVGVSTNYDNYLLIDFSDIYNKNKYVIEYIDSYPPFGDKPACRVYIKDDMKVELDFGKLASSINSMLCK